MKKAEQQQQSVVTRQQNCDTSFPFVKTIIAATRVEMAFCWPKWRRKSQFSHWNSLLWMAPVLALHCRNSKATFPLPGNEWNILRDLRNILLMLSHPDVYSGNVILPRDWIMFFRIRSRIPLFHFLRKRSRGVRDHLERNKTANLCTHSSMLHFNNTHTLIKALLKSVPLMYSNISDWCRTAEQNTKHTK